MLGEKGGFDAELAESRPLFSPEEDLFKLTESSTKNQTSYVTKNITLPSSESGKTTLHNIY